MIKEIYDLYFQWSITQSQQGETKLYAGKWDGPGDYDEGNNPSRQSHTFTNTQNLTYEQL
jgi:hypothetical protein